LAVQILSEMRSVL